MEDLSIYLRRYFTLLRRWAWLVVMSALLAAVAAYTVSARKTPLYRATTTLLIRASSRGMSEYQAVFYGQQIAPTYIAMLTGRPVLEEAYAQLGWDENPPAASPGSVSAELINDTQLVQVSVTGPDPTLSTEFANVIANVFITKYRSMQEGRYTESLVALQDQMDELSVQMQTLQSQIDELGTPETAQGQTDKTLLETTLVGYRNMYTILVRDHEQMRLAAAQTGDTVAIYESARMPEAQLGTRTRQNAILAGVAGAVVTIGVVFLIEMLDDTFKTDADVKETLNLSTLGVVTQMSSEGELVTIEEPRSSVAEAFRKLRTNIRFFGLDKPLRTLLVTSAGPSEGKSTIVANLAVVMAQAGLKVFLLDADLRRPRQHRIFSNIRTGGGLSGSLLNGHVDGHLQPVQDVKGLFVLPTGGKPPNPAEMLGSQRMKDLLEELKQQADVILVDSPPVLPVTDAAVLSQIVDGVLLVIHTGETRRGAARQVLETMSQVRGNLIGAVLNRVPTRKGVYGGYSYYNYGYYYGAYYGDENENESRRKSPNGVFKTTMQRLFKRKQKVQ